MIGSVGLVLQRTNYYGVDRMTTIKQRKISPSGILQEWVTKLGLRQQGVLVTSIRGADTAPKNDSSKDFTRALRGIILNTHCENPQDARSFIECCDSRELERRFDAFCNDLDHYPHHFVMHLVHAVEVIAYCHSDTVIVAEWSRFYSRLCRGLHLNPETPEQMDARLDADESKFGG